MTVPDDADQAHGDLGGFRGALHPLAEMERTGRRDFIRLCVLGAVAVLIALAILGWISRAHANDDGRFADSPLKAWFDRLASGKGLCCSFADGVSIEDVDWDTTGDADFPYRVRLDGQWVKVPAAAAVTEPNKFGRAVVWPYKDAEGTTQIRCFMPGAGA